MSRTFTRNPSQYEMFRAAERRAAQFDQQMLDALYGPNPLTDDELRRLIAKRPHLYKRFQGYLGKRATARGGKVAYAMSPSHG